MQIFELMGSILIDDKKATTALDNVDKKASGVSKGMGLSFGNIVSSALKVGAVIGAGLGLKDMITNTMNAQNRLAQMNAVLTSTKGAAGMTSSELIKLADANSKVSTMSKGTNMDTQNLLLTFTNIGKTTFPRATVAVNDMATSLKEDASSAAMQLGKALNDPIAGVTALQRVGVKLTDQQKEQVKAMVAVGNTAGAQKIILDELSKEFGGSALAASKTLGGQFTILKNQLAGVGVSIGNAVLPYLTQFVSFINAHMPQIQQVIGVVTKAIGEGLKSVGQFIITTVIPAFQSFYNWIKPYMPQIQDIVKVASDIIKSVLKVISDFVVNQLVPTFKAMADWFIANFPAIKNAVMAAYNYIKPSFDALVQAIKDNVIPIVKGLLDTFNKAMPGIKAICQMVFPIVVAVIKTAIDIITTIIRVVGTIYQAIAPGLNAVASIFSGVFGTIKLAIQGVIDLIHVFNGITLNNKTATVSTVTSGTGLVGRASGDSNWKGGLGLFNEAGGEIMNLPNHTQIIPHDVSMEMAKNKDTKKDSKPTTVQLVLQNGKVIAEYLLDSTDNLAGNKNKILARGQGVCLG